MANKKVGYKEPASYFNDDMKKAAQKWEREHKQAQKKSEESKKKSSGKK